MSEGEETIEQKLARFEQKFEDEARPKLEDYIKRQGWEGATIVNRFVIERGGVYYVQTVDGVREVKPEKGGSTFSMRETNLDAWLEEDEFSKRLRKMSGGGLRISGGNLGSVSIGDIEVGGGRSKIGKVDIKNSSELTVETPGTKLTISSDNSGIKFKIKV